jgi:hypothetical protein
MRLRSSGRSMKSPPTLCRDLQSEPLPAAVLQSAYRRSGWEGHGGVGRTLGRQPAFLTFQGTTRAGSVTWVTNSSRWSDKPLATPRDACQIGSLVSMIAKG